MFEFLSESNSKYAIAIILISAFIISGFGLNLMLVDDEAFVGMMQLDLQNDKYPEYQHPPMALVSLLINIKLQELVKGIGIILSIRFLPLIYGLLTILLVYLLSEKIYDRKLALLAAAIMAFSFYHIFASLLVDTDGNIFTLFLTAAIFSYYKLNETHKQKWLIAAGLFFGLSLLTKYTAIVLIPILLVFELFNSSFKNHELKNISFVSAVGFLILSVFPITTFLLNVPDLFWSTIKWGSGSVIKLDDFAFTFIKALFKYSYRIVQYGTPLLFFMPIIAFLKRENKKEWLFFSWLIVGFIFLVLTSPKGSIERYLMILIPALSVLSAVGIKKIIEKVNKKTSTYLLGSVIVFLGIIIALNLFKVTKTPFSFEFFNLSLLLQNPDVWMTSTSGPLFVVSAYSLMLTALVGLFLFGVYLISKNVITKKNAIILLIGISLAFNIFLIGEYFFYGFGPNYNNVIQEMVTYAEENEIKEPVFSISEDVPFYLGKDFHSYYTITKSKNRELLAGGGTVFFLNMPEKRNEMWDDSVKYCNIKKIIYEKGYEAGFILEC